MDRSWRLPLLVCWLTALLAACAAPPPQALVSVFTSGVQVVPGSTYRYDRLPSQAGRPDAAFLESVADASLARAGMHRIEGNARLAIQVTVSENGVAYAPGWGGTSVGVGIGGGGHGGGVGLGFSLPLGGAPVHPSLRVDVQLRDLPSGQVVFQSQASSSSGANPAMLLDAALRDFPNGPPGTRVVPFPGY